MRASALRVTIGIFLVLVTHCASTSPRDVNRIGDLKPTVLLVSLDGFRWDYLDKYRAAHLEKFAREGVRAKSLTSVFPSATFPNHYSIVTGLYAEEHGIVANEMIEPHTGVKFEMRDSSSTKDSRWWGGEPIWITAERQGQLTAPLFWVGSHVEIEGRRPTYWLPYDKKMTRSERVGRILKWIDLPVEKRPTFLTLYFEGVDSAGHEFGPDSAEVDRAVAEVDAELGNLLSAFEARGIFDQVNVIVVSDHGMASVAEDHFIPIEEMIKSIDGEILGSGAFGGLFLKSGNPEATAKTLSHVHPHLRAYSKGEIPERFHFRSNSRIPDVLLLADEGWYMARSSTTPAKKKAIKGAHGYDNALPSMQGIFIARGPAFNRGVKIGPIASVEIYGLIARILSLKPAPNHGKPANVRGIFSGGEK